MKTYHWVLVEYYGPTRPVAVAYFDDENEARARFFSHPRYRPLGLLVEEKECATCGSDGSACVDCGEEVSK